MPDPSELQRDDEWKHLVNPQAPRFDNQRLGMQLRISNLRDQWSLRLLRVSFDRFCNAWWRRQMT